MRMCLQMPTRRDTVSLNGRRCQKWTCAYLCAHIYHPVRITVVSDCDPILSRGERTENRYFNTSCFVRTPKGSWGTNQPIVRQPGNGNLDLSLSKSFQTGKNNSRIQVRADAYNALNVSTRTVNIAAQFDASGNQVNSDFGRLALPTSEARQIELSLKWIF